MQREFISAIIGLDVAFQEGVFGCRVVFDGVGDMVRGICFGPCAVQALVEVEESRNWGFMPGSRGEELIMAMGILGEDQSEEKRLDVAMSLSDIEGKSMVEVESCKSEVSKGPRSSATADYIHMEVQGMDQ